MEIKFNI